ncbi:NAD(P)/FAD-dependent oxidoreductase [Haliovirga abyssi]|uniref:FAD/NAD(P)-binding oxidoreductase n=1 Tax=Haliovirga abyssi TaxID=2996794 RepID=A0AAU9D9T0_9FUSO|nr:NAD(P)/FAD-dependent oxidoreductase [Haliovirga abyssi]BDU51393.1 FAD/NAD(P)-binding oxidoreductase [Haliovirga abyssi]
MYDVVIIGAGIIGTSIGRELSKYKLKTLIIEKESDVANGTTKANSAIIHAGYDARPNSLMAKFNTLGNPMFDKLCEELDVPFKRVGSFVLAFSKDEMPAIGELYERGIKNNIPKMQILTGKEIRKMEPNISKDVVGGLYAETAGIVGPWELAIALSENAIKNGVELKLNNEVKSIIKIENGYEITTDKGRYKTKYIINASGVYADKINNMVASPAFSINPRRGQYFIMDKNFGNKVNKVLFQCPNNMGKGVLVAPTVHGNVIVGPNAEDYMERDDVETTRDGLNYVWETAKKTIPELPFREVITNFSGLRAESSTKDFVIEESKDAKGFINVAGIKSPGLSSAPAIAEYVVELLKDINGGLEENKNFIANRKQIIFMDLSDEEKAVLIKKDNKYGKIICRCENITEGEIVAAIKAGADTVDGVKKRCRPGMGRCQGGFCGPRVQEILAREKKKDMKDIVKDNPKSYVLIGRTKGKEAE